MKLAAVVFGATLVLLGTFGLGAWTVRVIDDIRNNQPPK